VNTVDDTIAQRVAALGLDPRGYPVEPGADEYDAAGEDEFALPTRWVPWGADAAELTGDPEDEGQTVLDHLGNLAEAQGMDLVEYLGLDDDPDCE
jgi:hypothetical protein